MLLAIVFANVWGVLQLVALGSFARTIRVRTALLGVAVGFFVCAPLAALVEHGWATLVAWATGNPADAILAVAAYTVDPFLEELILVLPLLLLLGLPVVRRQWSITDCVLIGAALGAGFGLAEDLYRFGSLPHRAVALPGGWVVPGQSWLGSTTVAYVFVPGIWTSISTWLPDLGTVRLLPPSASPLPNLMLVWSAVGGLAVGLTLTRRAPVRPWLAAALFVFAAMEHAALNADIMLGEQALTAPLRATRGLVPYVPAAALAIAWWLDRHRQRSESQELFLALERSGSSRIVGTLQAATRRLPKSMAWVDGFVRLRRAYNSERHSGASTPDLEKLRTALNQLCEHFDRELLKPASLGSLLQFKSRAAATLCQPGTILWLVLALPSLLWFAVGGWPQTAWVQGFLSAGAGWSLVVVLSVVLQLWLTKRVLRSLRSWRTLTQLPVADVVSTHVLRMIATVGAICFGGYGLARAFGLWSTAAPPLLAGHAADAVESCAPAQLLPMAGCGVTLQDGWDKDYRFQPYQDAPKRPIMSPADTPASWPGEKPTPAGAPDLPLEDANWIIDLVVGGAKGGVELGLRHTKWHVFKHFVVDFVAEKALHHVPPLTVREGMDDVEIIDGRTDSFDGGAPRPATPPDPDEK